MGINSTTGGKRPLYTMTRAPPRSSVETARSVKPSDRRRGFRGYAAGPGEIDVDEGVPRHGQTNKTPSLRVKSNSRDTLISVIRIYCCLVEIAVYMYFSLFSTRPRSEISVIIVSISVRGCFSIFTSRSCF